MNEKVILLPFRCHKRPVPRLPLNLEPHKLSQGKWQLNRYLFHDFRGHPTRCANKRMSDIFTGVVFSGCKPRTDTKVGDHHTAFLTEQNVSCLYISVCP